MNKKLLGFIIDTSLTDEIYWAYFDNYEWHYNAKQLAVTSVGMSVLWM